MNELKYKVTQAGIIIIVVKYAILAMLAMLARVEREGRDCFQP